MELASLLREKPSSFVPRDLPCIAWVLDAQHNKKPITDAPGATEITNMQQDAFDLVMRQLDYDERAYRVWKGKLHNYDAVRSSALKEWECGDTALPSTPNTDPPTTH